MGCLMDRVQILFLSAAEAVASPQALALVRDFAFLCEGWPGAEAEVEAKTALADLPSEARVWVLAVGGAWRWLMAWHPLTFDTEVFGRGVARLALFAHHRQWPHTQTREQGRTLLAQLVTDAFGEGIEGLWARVPSRDLLAAQTLEKAGFLFYDPGVEWELDLAELLPAPLGPAVTVRQAEPSDQKALADLAALAFCRPEDYADRFALDPRLREGCAGLYRRWLLNSLSGEQADQVLVLEHAGWAQGFITLRKASGAPGPRGCCGRVVLNAISPALRGKGCYHSLLWAGLDWLRAQGVPRARVRTKASQAAVIRAWARLGARPALSDLTFHHWMEQP
jgi:GNAT superfamily N-acetyltransferase